MRALHALLFAVALLVGGAALVAAGPLPGDVACTRALQDLLGPEPAWAPPVTRTAKPPQVWATLAVAVALVGVARGRVLAGLAAPAAFVIAFAVDKALRAMIHVPKPTGDLVAVAKASSSSGLPSTFGLVYASLFGLLVLAPERPARAHALRVLGLALLALGATSRVVLGGHWASQMLPSLCVGLLIASSATGLVGFRRKDAGAD